MDPTAPPPGSLAAALRAGPLGLRRIPGSTLGPYEVLAEVGRGGFGVVLRARRRDRPGVDVALKVLLDGPQAGAARERRFEREAALSRALRHPGVVPVLDAGRLDDVAFIAFEFVEGTTLTTVFDEAPLARRLDLLTKVARAVAHAHARGVVHRDLKPANVLVRRADGRPLVADFGLARDTALDSSLTRTGAMLGTPAYMAPEQVSGRPPTSATDVFALGVMLHEALTGDLPFRADNVAMRYAAILAGNLEAPSARAGSPPALDAVVRRALAAKPEDRYPDAGALADAIDAALGTSSRDDGDDPGDPGEATTRAAAPARPWQSLALAGLAALGAALPLGLVISRALARAAARDRAETSLTARAADLTQALAARRPTLEPARALEGALRDVAGDEHAVGARVARARGEAHVALAAWHLAEGRVDEARAALDAARALAPDAGGLSLGDALVQVALGRPTTPSALPEKVDPAPFPRDLVDEARARTLAARDHGPAALAALDAALARARTGPRLMLRARLLLGEGRTDDALLDHEAALALGAADEPDLAAALARARLARATRLLSAPGLEPTDAARGLADARAALAVPDDRAPLGALALEAGFGLLQRMAAERDPPLPPTADASRAAHGLLELAAGLDPPRTVMPADYMRVAVNLCQRDDCAPAVRFQVASWMRRRRLPFDPMRDVDLRLADPAADFSGLWVRLRMDLQAAGDDPLLALNAYRTFSHVARGTPALLPVAWEAEEEGLTRWPTGSERFHVLLARALTLQAMKRGDEGRPLMAEAVALSRQHGPEWAADTLFWSSGFHLGEGRPAQAQAEVEEGTALYASVGQGWPNNWWALHAASCLLALGRHAEALAAVEKGRALGGADPQALDQLEARIRAARGS